MQVPVYMSCSIDSGFSGSAHPFHAIKNITLPNYNTNSREQEECKNPYPTSQLLNNKLAKITNGNQNCNISSNMRTV